jgi:hypothetical protein
MKARELIRSSLIAMLLVALLAGAGVAAPCGPGTLPPQCDGACPPDQMCANSGGSCVCQPAPFACQDPGNPSGPPLCWGECPPSAPICATLAGGCACVVPTLSEWGIIGMALVMFGGVLALRRRRA